MTGILSFPPNVRKRVRNAIPAVKDVEFGAKGDGATNDAAAFTTARASSGLKYIAASVAAYVLGSAPAVGPGAFLADPGATFSGAGTLNGLPDFGRGLHPDNGGSNIWRFQDRLFVGLPTTGNRFGAQNSILPNAAAGAGYLCRDGQVVSVSPYGQIGVVGFSRSGDTPDVVLTDCMGLAGGVINNRTDGKSWGVYSDIQHEGTQASSYGLETALKNTSGVTRKYTPYGITGASPGAGVIGWQVFAGGDPSYGGAANAPITAGINFVANSNAIALSTGINFGQNSIVGNDGLGSGDGDAILFASGHRMRWMGSTTRTAASIWAQNVAATSAVHIKFGANVAEFHNNAEVPVFKVNTSGASIVNYLQASGAGTGANPLLAALGSDTDVGLTVSSQGAGSINFNSNGGTVLNFQVLGSTSSIVNFIRAQGAVTTGNPRLTATGSDANVSMLIVGKGTGGLIAQDGGGTNRIQMTTTGIGFHGTAPVAKGTITGSRGGNAALASLLTYLASRGDFTDSTTA